MKNKIYSIEGVPTTKQEVARIIHNLNVDIVKDLKKHKIDEGFIHTALSAKPFGYVAKYLESNENVNIHGNQQLIPVEVFIEYMRVH
jgi:hypothetical protein